MAQSAFSIYRGSAYLFYFDTTRQYFPYHSSAARHTWIQGDLHFENSGAFRSEDGDIVYDVNDFEPALGEFRGPALPKQNTAMEHLWLSVEDP